MLVLLGAELLSIDGNVMLDQLNPMHGNKNLTHAHFSLLFLSSFHQGR